jgi:hypothetical protein
VIIAKSSEFIHAFSTCLAESAHGWRIRWANKDIDYWATFRGRCFLTVLWHYLGPKAIIAVFDELKMELEQEQRDTIVKYSRVIEKARARDRSTDVMKHKNVKKKERKAERGRQREVTRKNTASYKTDKSLFTDEELGREGASAKKSKRATRAEITELFKRGDLKYLA